MGKTKLDSVTWHIAPSVSPKGTHVTAHVDGGEHGSVWLYLNAKQAHTLSKALKQAADWCDKHR